MAMIVSYYILLALTSCMYKKFSNIIIILMTKFSSRLRKIHSTYYMVTYKIIYAYHLHKSLKSVLS